MRPSLRFVVVAGITAAVASSARADDLADARAAAGQLEYERALAIVERVLARVDNDPARFVELELLAGQLAAGLDRAADAQHHYARALALRPDLALPPDASPKLIAPFEAARADQRRPLRVHADVVPGLARIAIDDDALDLVAGIAVDVVDAGGAHRELRARASTRIELPPGTHVVELSALDADGNRLWIAAAPSTDAGTLSASRTADARPLVARWPAWATLAGIALVAGAGFAWREHAAQDDWNQLRAQDGLHDYSTLSAVESRGRTDAVAADLGFGVALGAGITALVLGVRHLDHAPAITIGAASVGVAASF